MTDPHRWSVRILSFVIALAGLAGCSRPSEKDAAKADVGHESSIVWLEQKLEVQGLTISLGYRETTNSSKGSIEPTVTITKDGHPVADAMVFCRLVSTSDNTLLGDEVATVYEEDVQGKSACYAQGRLSLPADHAAVAIRFRIILADTDEPWTREVVLPANATRNVRSN